jgi:exonuclease III
LEYKWWVNILKFLTTWKGIRSVNTKTHGVGTISTLFSKFDADIFCFQETRVTSMAQLDRNIIHVPGYESFWSVSKSRKVKVLVYCIIRNTLSWHYWRLHWNFIIILVSLLELWHHDVRCTLWWLIIH